MIDERDKLNATPNQAEPSALQLFTSEFAQNPHPLYRQLRDRAVTSFGTGDERVVLISRYEDVHEALRHPGVFSSAEDPIDLGTSRPLIPLQVDPPRHARYRRLLDPLFSPKAIDAMEDDIRELARGLMVGIVDRGACDFHAEFSVPFPCTIFLQIMGLPLADLDQFLAWKDGIIRPAVEDPFDLEAMKEVRTQTGRAIDAYFEAALEERLNAPREDLLSLFLHAEIEGERLDQDEVLGLCYLFLLGGLDTVTASLDCMMARLAAHPDERRRLVDDPTLIPSAIEELLRFETPVTMVPRVVTESTCIGAHHIDEGAHVMLLLGAANTDECAFDRAGEVDFARAGNRHFAFSGGPHRCLGSHLARRELRVAIEEWHRVIPDYAIDPETVLKYSPGIRQIEQLALIFRRDHRR